mmetsp:Transcript_18960/g.35184  ORF Transcript_18960/g.35184 Transcript_18960/m.35184 type:complete len:267 (+) Transcript_18960:939-1739(+)
MAAADLFALDDRVRVPAHPGALDVVGLVDDLARVEDIGHDDERVVSAVHSDAVAAVEPGEKRTLVLLIDQVLGVGDQDAEEALQLLRRRGLDDVLAVLGEEHERSGGAGGELLLSGVLKGPDVRGRFDAKSGSDAGKDVGTVIPELDPPRCFDTGLTPTRAVGVRLQRKRQILLVNDRGGQDGFALAVLRFSLCLGELSVLQLNIELCHLLLLHKDVHPPVGRRPVGVPRDRLDDAPGGEVENLLAKRLVQLGGKVASDKVQLLTP